MGKREECVAVWWLKWLRQWKQIIQRYIKFIN